MRKLIHLNEDWKFLKQDEVSAMKVEYNDENWSQVHLPHTWNAIDGANGFDYFQGACWYRKAFMIDEFEQHNKVYIEFNGANS